MAVAIKEVKNLNVNRQNNDQARAAGEFWAQRHAGAAAAAPLLAPGRRRGVRRLAGLFLTETALLGDRHTPRDAPLPPFCVAGQAILSLSLDADLRSAFSWNTKQLFVFLSADYETEAHGVNQVVLWDRIITRQADAHIQLPNLRQKYAFVDMGRRLRDRRLNLTLRWNVMPRVGALYTGEASFPAGPLPSAYLH